MERQRSARTVREVSSTSTRASVNEENVGKTSTSSKTNTTSGTGEPPNERRAPRNENRVCNGLLLGQLLSALMATTGISAASLDDRGVNLPSFVNLLNYGLLATIFLLPTLISRKPLRLPWWRYALYALVDVEANTAVVLSFRYTSITSITMLDAFSIPAVMVLSRLFLRARYNRTHLAGVVLCVGGLALIVVSDLHRRASSEDHPHALKGDLLCILGATLYAVANVTQENFVKNHDRREFLGMAGFFGVVIAGVQTFWMERQQLADTQWTVAILLFTGGYATSLFLLYSWTSMFLQDGDAALFNLSLLTSDIYALIFAYVVESNTPNWIYFVAFVIIFAGLFLYHSQPPATRAEPVRMEPLEDDRGDARGSRQRSSFFALSDAADGSNSKGSACDIELTDSDTEAAPVSPAVNSAFL